MDKRDRVPKILRNTCVSFCFVSNFIFNFLDGSNHQIKTYAKKFVTSFLAATVPNNDLPI